MLTIREVTKVKIFVNVKSLGRIKASVEQIPFELADTPADVRELITGMVAVCVERFMERAANSEVLSVMTESDIADRAQSGKISFGAVNGEAEVDILKAQANAVQCFEDGIYRIFLNDKPLEALDEKLTLNDNSQLTFVRLTMLAGRLW